MTPVHAIMVLMIRLWAAGIIISQTRALSYLPFAGKSFDNVSSYYVIHSYTYAGMVLALGLLAWILAPRLAKLVYPKKDAETVSIAVNADTLVMIGSFLIGLFYLAEYLPQLSVQGATMVAEMMKDDPSGPYSTGTIRTIPFAMRDLVSSLLVVFAAFWMAFRPAHIANMFSKLRRAGLAKVKEE